MDLLEILFCKGLPLNPGYKESVVLKHRSLKDMTNSNHQQLSVHNWMNKEVKFQLGNILQQVVSGTCHPTNLLWQKQKQHPEYSGNDWKTTMWILHLVLQQLPIVQVCSIWKNTLRCVNNPKSINASNNIPCINLQVPSCNFTSLRNMSTEDLANLHV